MYAHKVTAACLKPFFILFEFLQLLSLLHPSIASLLEVRYKCLRSALPIKNNGIIPHAKAIYSWQHAWSAFSITPCITMPKVMVTHFVWFKMEIWGWNLMNYGKLDSFIHAFCDQIPTMIAEGTDPILFFLYCVTCRNASKQHFLVPVRVHAPFMFSISAF